ncbi:hypothetical protein QE152_g31473 [Popillia japonica]|uniref:Uncharacterized protein n=1 Tax=Popillia japonica TaxID=7064 RepID=A0AAW1J1C0_POPJA
MQKDPNNAHKGAKTRRRENRSYIENDNEYENGPERNEKRGAPNKTRTKSDIRKTKEGAIEVTAEIKTATKLREKIYIIELHIEDDKKQIMQNKKKLRDLLSIWEQD